MRQNVSTHDRNTNGGAMMVTRVAADDLLGMDRGCDNEHTDKVRYDGPVPTLTPVHQQESSSLAPDAG